MKSKEILTHATAKGFYSKELNFMKKIIVLKQDDV